MDLILTYTTYQEYGGTLAESLFKRYNLKAQSYLKKVYPSLSIDDLTDDEKAAVYACLTELVDAVQNYSARAGKSSESIGDLSVSYSSYEATSATDDYAEIIERWLGSLDLTSEDTSMGWI